ncbi:glutathione S-transferase family protein [Aestuariibius insulae]|uniref:glutathione S-transferase family protein n=1 Tax=Aestuariibius insulae TaxID=2058287 RepID=UPI00345E27B7
MTYTLYGTAKSRAMRVIWCLNELDQPFDHIPCGPRAKEIQALTPSGKIPVLQVDETTLTDSTAILSFLADRHGALTHPPGTTERAQQDAHMLFVLDEVESLLWTAARHTFALPEDLRVPQIKDSLRAEWPTSLARLSERVGDGPYLCGETFTIADIVASHCLGWAKMARFDWDDPVLAAYNDRCRARPAFKTSQTAP